MKTLLDPVILFFILGAFAGIIKSNLRIPEAFYNVLTIYLLLAIGIKGGIELSHNPIGNLILPGLGTIVLGAVIAYLAFFFLYKIGSIDKINSISIATHYGSVSAVTFAVVLSFLSDQKISYEEYSTVLLVLLEIPAIGVGVLMAKLASSRKNINIKILAHEVFFGKAILLLIGGLGIGYVTGKTENTQLNFFFFDLFKGFLALFMLEMGIVTSQRLKDFAKVGPFLLLFSIAMPLISSILGILTAYFTGMSMGGAVVLGTMAASASYIAAPAAMRITLPEANPTLSLTCALGITFPFNIIFGIPLYYKMSEFFYGWM